VRTYNRDGVAGEVRRTLLRHAENGKARMGKPS
jgi:hypothetical protein